jgi:hypothetical protein
LINSIFKKRSKEKSKRNYPGNHFEYMLDLSKKLKNFSKYRHMSRLGLRRIDRELDVVYFIRKTMM